VEAPRTLDRPIGRDPRHRQKMSSRGRRVRPAVTEILSSTPLGGVSLLRVTIQTGRTHQIRVHLSEDGHAVVGDAIYGGVRKSLPPAFAPLLRLRRPFLHALRLTFAHPGTGATMTFEAPLADDLQAVLEALRSLTARPDARAAGARTERRP
jgi:23S rRNA pseudouridine1911/1915/1917 synthase